MISIPTLIVDESICRANIARMADKARKNNIELRPHFKTHQSHYIGEWYREYGVTGITVSSLRMAQYFADAGWNDITVAFPCNITEVDRINEIAANVSIRILVSNHQIAELLAQKLTNHVDVYIEIDEGGGRTGFHYKDTELIEKSVKIINESSFMTFYGIYCHVGQTYTKKGKTEVTHFANSVLSNLTGLKNELISKYGAINLCYGDTPSCSVLESFPGVDELSTGNFIFYDVMQTEIGSCNISDVGLALACPVVSVSTHKSEVCIYGGAVHLSKDKTEENNFGLIARKKNEVWQIITGATLKKVSQEHGIIRMLNDELEKIKIGEILYVLPIHSCLTADCMGVYQLNDGTYIDHMAQKKHAF